MKTSDDEVIRLYNEYTALHGVQPRTKVGTALGVGRYRLEQLEAKGLLVLAPKVSRAAAGRSGAKRYNFGRSRDGART